MHTPTMLASNMAAMLVAILFTMIAAMRVAILVTMIAAMLASKIVAMLLQTLLRCFLSAFWRTFSQQAMIAPLLALWPLQCLY